MTGAIKAELRKFFTTRMWWGMAAAVAVTSAGFAFLFAIVYTLDLSAEEMQASGMGSGDPSQIANSVYTGGISVGYLLMLTIGVMQIGSEYRHKTITSTFLAVPRRARAMLAKVAALGVLGAMYAVISMVFAVAIGAIVLSARGAEAFPSSDVWRTIALSLLVLALWALIGLGVGILIPNQVAALLIGVGVAWIVEPILGLVLNIWETTSEYVAPYLPSAATQATLNAVAQPGAHPLEWWAGALTLTAWAAVFAGLGIWRTMRQDIS